MKTLKRTEFLHHNLVWAKQIVFFSKNESELMSLYFPLTTLLYEAK
jgi:hypothetical protein